MDQQTGETVIITIDLPSYIVCVINDWEKLSSSRRRRRRTNAVRLRRPKNPHRQPLPPHTHTYTDAAS